MTEEYTPHPFLEELAEHMASNEEAQSDITEEVWPYTTLEQAKQLNRSLMEKIIDRAASDPAWKQQLLDDPEAALRGFSVPDLKEPRRGEAGGGVDWLVFWEIDSIQYVIR